MEGYNQDNITDSGELTRDWAELIGECLRNILSRLSSEDRWLGAMRVCKAWLKECKDQTLNSVFDLETNFESITELPQFWTPEFESRIDNMIVSVVGWSKGSLSEIRVRHCSNRSLSLVAQRCPNIQVLSIKNSPNVSDLVVAEMAFGCPKLKELDISYCYKISHKSLATIGLHCPNLHILRRNIMNWVDPSPHFGIIPDEYLKRDGDLEATAIGLYLSHLLHLELQFSKLTGIGLDLISEGCLDLQYIDLSGCSSVKSLDIENAKSKLKNLKSRSLIFISQGQGPFSMYDD